VENRPLIFQWSPPSLTWRIRGERRRTSNQRVVVVDCRCWRWRWCRCWSRLSTLWRILCFEWWR